MVGTTVNAVVLQRGLRGAGSGSRVTRAVHTVCTGKVKRNGLRDADCDEGRTGWLRLRLRRR